MESTSVGKRLGGVLSNILFKTTSFSNYKRN
jgi:hypothetical protein